MEKYFLIECEVKEGGFVAFLLCFRIYSECTAEVNETGILIEIGVKEIQRIVNEKNENLPFNFGMYGYLYSAVQVKKKLYLIIFSFRN